MICNKFLYFYVLIFLVFKSTLTIAKPDLNECDWDNRNGKTCLTIKKNISNSSKFSSKSINKIIISKKEINEMNAVDLVDVLKTIPNLNITQSGPKGQQASLFMSGTGSNHTLVLINGIPINDQSTTQGLHDFGVDFIQTIQQIEVYPGSNAIHFGTNAIGGAINIILTGDFKNSFLLSGRNNSNYEISGNKTYVFDNSSLNFKIGSVKNESISVRGNSNDEKDQLKNYTVNINFDKYLNENSKFYFTNYLRQTIADYDNSSSNQDGYKGDNKMGSFQFGLNNSNMKMSNNYVIFYNNYDREYDERGTLDTYKSEAMGIKYDMDKEINDKISFGGGSEYIYNLGQFDNRGSYQASTKGNSNNFAIYGNIGWHILENSTISLFTRNDEHKQTGSNRTYKFNFENFFKNKKLGFSYMTGLRNPTLYELFGTDNYGYSGNKNLKAEKSNTFEVYTGLNFNKNIKLSIRGFKSNIKDNIEYINNQYQNDTDNINLNQSGVSNELQYKSNNTNIKIFSSFLSSKKENGSHQLRRPQKSYGFNLNKNLNLSMIKDLNLNILYNHYGKHFDTHSVNFNTIEMDSTDIVDLKLSRKFNNFDFFFKVSNLFNENYEGPHGYNQENRLIKFGFKY